MLVVSHKATVRILVCALLGMDVRLFRDRIGQPVCALSRFQIKPQGTAMLTMLGDVSHLPPELREAPRGLDRARVPHSRRQAD